MFVLLLIEPDVLAVVNFLLPKIFAQSESDLDLHPRIMINIKNTAIKNEKCFEKMLLNLFISPLS